MIADDWAEAIFSRKDETTQDTNGYSFFFLVTYLHVLQLFKSLSYSSSEASSLTKMSKKGPILMGISSSIHTAFPNKSLCTRSDPEFFYLPNSLCLVPEKKNVFVMCLDLVSPSFFYLPYENQYLSYADLFSLISFKAVHLCMYVSSLVFDFFRVIRIRKFQNLQWSWSVRNNCVQLIERNY